MMKYIILYTCYDNDTIYSDCCPTTYDTLEKAREEKTKQLNDDLYYFNDFAHANEDMDDITYHIEDDTIYVTADGKTKPITKYNIGAIVV